MKAFASRFVFFACAPLFIAGLLTSGAQLSAAAQSPNKQLQILLGEQLFFDKQLSNPAGMACSSCHDPAAGFSYPISSVNASLGPVPGVVKGRFGNRIPPSAAYAAYVQQGLPKYDPQLAAYVGGVFWDGRAASLTNQALAPFLNPNEMNNLLHDLGEPTMVVAAVKNGPFGNLFKQVYGGNVFSESTSAVYSLIAGAIAAYETFPSVNQLSSKYDAWRKGRATLTDAELDGLRLVTGSWTGRPGGPAYYKNAQCTSCHSIPTDTASGPDLWTDSRYANIGAPRNPNNPFYKMTDSTADPEGFNALGENYVDFGLGDFLYVELGKPSGDLMEGDPLGLDGTFKAPTLRNVDKRPSPGFVKAYFHNGVFKSLKQVVHFYNTRNLTTYPGEVIDFSQANPYAHLKGKPLWPEPEYISAVTMQNPAGLPNSGVDTVGNLGLSEKQEDDIVAFLQTLSDGYFNGPEIRP
ncbi:MAG TPA: cytochrome c peroxidase [Fimbriimonadaceae bacterium]